jgi:hypothetical protein
VRLLALIFFTWFAWPALADNSLPQLSALKPSPPQPGRYAVSIDFRKEKYPTREIYESESLRATMVLDLLKDGRAKLMTGYQRHESGSVSHFASADHEDHQSSNQEGTEECHQGRWARRGAFVDLDLHGCKAEHASQKLSCTAAEKDLLICEGESLNDAFKIPIEENRRAVLARDPGIRVLWRDERNDRTPRIHLVPATKTIVADDYKH